MADPVPQRQPWEPTASFQAPVADTPALVLGRYRILEPIGGGGMGTVYKALHVHLKQLVAIKTIVLGTQRAHHAALIERFRREMEAIGAIQHPNVVRATDGGEENGTCFLVMEFVPGTDLAVLVQELGPLPVADACELIRQAAVGLSCIHARGLVHRDIKPSNLLFANHTVKIADLGLARFRKAVDGREELTPDGQALGTPDYMAPEQALNARAADIRADIYSLGCSLFRVLTGQPPYPSSRFETYAQKIMAHQQAPIPAVATALAALGYQDEHAAWPAVDALLRRMLAKDAGERFSNPDEVAAALAPLAVRSDLSELWRRWQTKKRLFDSTPGQAETETSNPYQAVTPGAQAARSDTPSARRFPLRIAAVAFLTILAAAFGVAIYLKWFHFAEAPAHGTAASLDDMPELRWHELLEQPPTLIHWPRDAGFSDWRHDADLHQLTLQTKNLGLMQLGETHATHYLLRIGLFQNRWSGGVGVYLGCRLPDHQGGAGRLQFLELREERNRAGARQLNLTRGFLELTRAKNGELIASPSSVGSHSLKDVRGEQTLELTVANNLLRRVRVNGVELPNLLDSTVSAHFSAADQAGGFGVIVESSDGVFRNAQFMRLNEAP